MKVIFNGTQEQFISLQQTLPHVQWNQVSDSNDTASPLYNDAVAVFDFSIESTNKYPDNLIVFKNALFIPEQTPPNVWYIIPWIPFLENESWEIGGNENERINTVLLQLNKKGLFIPAETGLVSARVIAMIINEAYFALEDEISTKEAIDIAMKLGTGYPYGPFEWCEKIGSRNVVELLQQLTQIDTRYTPAARLLKEAGI
jgi:3-hydroxybutyryl-CoA dehydrogenase